MHLISMDVLPGKTINLAMKYGYPAPFNLLGFPKPIDALG